MMLSEVDRRVDSGEIETVYLQEKCYSKNCQVESRNIPEKALNQVHQVKIIANEDEQQEDQQGDNLYLK